MCIRDRTYTTTLSNDQLKSLTVQNQYETAATCGMAGLRSYSSQGVLLSDVLSEAGVNFGPGMTLKLRCSDQIEQNGTSETTEDAYIGNGTFTYEEIMADRYHYPAMWDNTTKYDELDGKTIYEVLSQDKDAWKTGGQYADFLSKKLGETKEKVEPLIGFQWSEGVVAWGEMCIRDRACTARSATRGWRRRWEPLRAWSPCGRTTKPTKWSLSMTVHPKRSRP